MKKNLIVFFFLLIANITIAKEEKYPVREIPKPLLSKSCVVIRDYSLSFKLISKGEGKTIVHIAKTILDDRGDDYANISLQYSKDIDLDINYIKYYDANGKLIKKVRNREIKDYSNNAGYVLLGDGRNKSFFYTPTTYPYTVEYEYEEECDGLLSYVKWLPVSSSRVSIQKSSLKVDVPKDIKVRYFKENIDKEIVKSELDDRIIYSLELNNMKCFEYEPYADYFEIFPYVEFHPTDFIYSDYSGNMSNWKNWGLWMNKLIKGRRELDEKTKNDVDKLIKGISDKREKVRILYKYLQSKTRYVCISLGIGGLQPMKASDVGKTGYGDCKALSNFMVSILKYAGIESYYCEIGNGNLKIRKPDFTSVSQTNHIIVCVPMKKDTIWLENTSQNIPFNYIGSGNSNRKALMIEDEGAKIVNTHMYSYKDNVNRVNSEIEISRDGKVSFDIKDIGSGLLAESYIYKLDESKEDLKKFHKRLISNGSSKIESIDYKLLNEGKDARVLNRVRYSVKISKDKNSLSIKMPLYNRIPLKIVRCRHRKYDAVVNTDYTHIDSIRIKVPKDFIFLKKDSVLNIENKYFKYSDRYSFEKGVLVYSREYIKKKARILPKEYKAYYRLYKKINKRQNTKFKFVNLLKITKNIYKSDIKK